MFSVDGLLQRVTVRIHGEVSSFWIRNPEGTFHVCISRQREEPIMENERWCTKGKELLCVADNLLLPTPTQESSRAQRKAMDL